MSDGITSRESKKDELLLLHMIERFNLITLALLTAGSWYMVDWPFAQSVLVGGTVVSASFFWMKRTAMRFVHHAATTKSGEQSSTSFSAGFTAKFYIRLIVLTILLILLSTQLSINVIGLAVGLSTVMLSIIIVVLLLGRMIFQENT